jgi:hypothetical protein
MPVPAIKAPIVRRRRGPQISAKIPVGICMAT